MPSFNVKKTAKKLYVISCNLSGKESKDAPKFDAKFKNKAFDENGLEVSESKRKETVTKIQNIVIDENLYPIPPLAALNLACSGQRKKPNSRTSFSLDG